MQLMAAGGCYSPATLLRESAQSTSPAGSSSFQHWKNDNIQELIQFQFLDRMES